MMTTSGEDTMQDIYEDFDPMLFRLWEVAPRPAAAPEVKSANGADDISGAPQSMAPCAEDAASAVPARISDDPAEQFRLLLNDMTVEMQAQFSTFRDLRRSAERLLADGDDQAQKLARADVKAATDAMALIVRTLEKIDTLQRQLVLDRERAEDAAAEANGFEEARARVLSMIEDRANARADMLYRAWQRDGPPRDASDTGRVRQEWPGQERTAPG